MENILDAGDMVLDTGNQLLENGEYVFAISGKVQATLTEGGKRKLKLGLKPVSTLTGEPVRGKFVNYKVEIDRVTADVKGETKTWHPAGKLFAALGMDAGQANSILAAVQTQFPTGEEFAAGMYNTVDLAINVDGEPITSIFEGKRVAAKIGRNEFNGNEYNAVDYFISQDRITAG